MFNMQVVRAISLWSRKNRRFYGLLGFCQAFFFPCVLCTHSPTHLERISLITTHLRLLAVKSLASPSTPFQFIVFTLMVTLLAPFSCYFVFRCSCAFHFWMNPDISCWFCFVFLGLCFVYFAPQSCPVTYLPPALPHPALYRLSSFTCTGSLS